MLGEREVPQVRVSDSSVTTCRRLSESQESTGSRQLIFEFQRGNQSVPPGSTPQAAGWHVRVVSHDPAAATSCPHLMQNCETYFLERPS
jgi:hypothetical protein